MIRRLSNQPLLSPQQLKPSDPCLRILGVFNPAAFIYEGKLCLLARIAEEALPIAGSVFTTPIWQDGLQLVSFNQTDLPAGWDADPRIFTDAHGRGWLTSLSQFRFFQSPDGGLSFIEREDLRIHPSGLYERYGIEDPRVVFFEGRYLIYYTSVSERGVTVSCIETTDFKSLDRKGVILAGPNKDVSLLPERLADGQCLLFHRPMDTILGRPTIWTATGPNPFTWTNHRQFMKVGSSDNGILKVGGGPEPIRCSKGWLFLLHTCSMEERYDLTLALCDAEDPSTLLAVAKRPLLSPELDWERRGFFGEVVFSNGWVKQPDGRVLIYYGGSDDCIGGAETTLSYLESFFMDVGF